MVPLVAVVASVALVLSACGGGSGGDGLSEKRAGEVAEQYVLDFFGILTGNVDAQRLIESFAPECREGVSAGDINAAVGFLRLFLPNLAEVEIEEVDLGKLKFEKTAEGILVVPEDPGAIRLKVKGKFVDAEELFAEMGFTESDDDDLGGPAEPLLIVERDGKAYLGDCANLQDFSI
jgi:hypothetical protein